MPVESQEDKFIVLCDVLNDFAQVKSEDKFCKWNILYCKLKICAQIRAMRPPLLMLRLWVYSETSKTDSKILLVFKVLFIQYF